MPQEQLPLILFQGDSVTDCGRSREDDSALGGGYPQLIASQLYARYPGQFRIANRGVSGNRVRNLLARWDEDCVSMQPALVSILIGINDVWRRYDSNDPIDVDAFYEQYRELLTRTRDGGASILLLEPFVLPVPEDRKRWRADLDPKIQAIRELAREFADAYVPLDGLFASQLSVPPATWAADGVHPTLAGHGLIAQAWLKAARPLLP